VVAIGGLGRCRELRGRRIDGRRLLRTAALVSVVLSLYPFAQPRAERRAETHPPSAPVGAGLAELRGRCSMAAGCCAQRYWHMTQSSLRLFHDVHHRGF
jgi:hypothetical protein